MNTARYMIEPPEPHSDLERQVASMAPWFHNLHLPDGTQTAPQHPLGDFPLCKWQQIAEHIPGDLRGWTVLDIGCNAGFYSIELARRGASVVGLDVDPHFLRQAEWAVRECGMSERVKLRQGEVYEIETWEETFDLVLFMGVFYHLRYPLLALDRVAAKVKRQMVFQTLTMPGDDIAPEVENLEIDERDLMRVESWPKMAFIEHSLAGDATNWWAPNHACICAMLRTAGLNVTAQPAHEIYICAPAKGATVPWTKSATPDHRRESL